MKKVPQIYAYPDKFAELSRMMSTFIAWGLDPVDLVMFLRQQFAVAGEDVVKSRIGALTAMVMERVSPPIAWKCAAMFGIRRPRVGRSLVETLYGDYFASYGWQGADEPSRECQMRFETLAPYANLAGTQLASPGDLVNIKCLNADDGLYIYRRTDGTLCVAAVNDTCSSSVIVDEETFCGEKPLYFTESSHFVSPVCTARTMADVLQWCMARLSYLNMRVTTQVIFTNAECEFLNIEEYRNDKTDRPVWEGVEVLLRRELPEGLLIGGTLPLIGEGCEALMEMDEVLSGAIGAASILYSNLPPDQFVGVGAFTGLDTRVLESLARRMGLFVSSRD